MATFHHNLLKMRLFGAHGDLVAARAGGGSDAGRRFAATVHNFVPAVVIVALGPTNFGIKGFFARETLSCGSA